ncbi:DUF4197 domain-containing protein [Kangiella spongicola]|uniref:DUF4197 domain-containing protein n=1 Tax=Kangiella spongicola TaxID=796379 RepID=A0A318D4W1_9GAMM|nr:DUF4197 domain-containing protein [Kangiella spongicola]MBV34112.1 hypothetical protein [Rickettsiales bacterium]PXF64352.1 DUF4197 domain-containing protein [Kangiella spongicola]
MKIIKIAITTVLAALVLTSCKTTDINRVLEGLGGNQQLSNETVVAGLKQALEVGTKNSVNSTNKPGGFSNNPLIKIAVPDELDNVAGALRKVGLGSYVNNFERQMNRAAEKASGEAKDVFIGAISSMSISDAWGILRGDDNAATNYFREKTQASLERRFQPIITNNMEKVGFYNDYKQLLGAYQKLPFTEKPNMNIEDYVMDETLDGLFTLVAQEEKKIRDNPVARTTELLQKVFSQQ